MVWHRWAEMQGGCSNSRKYTPDADRVRERKLLVNHARYFNSCASSGRTQPIFTSLAPSA